jgi:hypothetical protein
LIGVAQDTSALTVIGKGIVPALNLIDRMTTAGAVLSLLAVLLFFLPVAQADRTRRGV